MLRLKKIKQSNMKLFMSARQSGKTTRAINYLEENDDVLMIVYNEQMRHCIIENFKLKPHIADRIYTIGMLKYAKQKGKEPKIKKVVIDDAEGILKQLFSSFDLYIDRMYMSNNDPGFEVTVDGKKIKSNAPFKEN